MTTFATGSLVAVRGREWVVLPGSSAEFLVLRSLGGSDDDVAGVLTELEGPVAASFAPPDPATDVGDALSAGLLRDALRIGFRASAGPFRSLAGLAVDPRPYQYVPLLLALRQDVTRLLIADDVGIGKTIEAALIAAELLAQGDARGLAVLCSPALAQQWQTELRDKFGIDAELVLPSTVTRLQRTLAYDESLFERYPHVVVSTDFIKSTSRRDDFVRACPDLVIVDEAHTCVADGSGGNRNRTLRYELLRRLAADPGRHLVLVTATPHSGKEEGFRNLLGLLDPELTGVDLDAVRGRERLARHFVQRRRRDIRVYLDEETAFPRDRLLREAPYVLSPRYATLFRKVLGYAREQVRDTADGTVRQRVRWWSVLGLLRALASSPAAAVQTLGTRAASAEAVDAAEADALGRAAVLDTADEEALESADATPGADDDPERAADTRTRARLRGFAREAKALAGAGDVKLATATVEVKQLLADGFDPIVFCRFIDTAEYVATHLARALGASVSVAAVTGTLPPTERAARIEALIEGSDRRVLVATDCLSEGVNLQDGFSAVVHYDLAWNPTRHEQREGRVDRFGQRKEIVRVVTVYGRDNGIDGIVLDVLLRKHEAIRKATGVSVPVPDESDNVVQAVLEGLLFRGEQSEQLTLAGIGEERTEELHRDWESAAARESRALTKFAQAGIRPQDVAAEVRSVKTALGTAADVAGFTRESLRALGATVTSRLDGFTATTSELPLGLRDALPAVRREPLPFHADLPVPRGEAVLTRTDPSVEAVARFVLDAALDPSLPAALRPARRCAVIRTRAVDVRTTLLLVRYRFQLTLPGRAGTHHLVAEDAKLLAFRGSPPQLLPESDVPSLLAAQPDQSIPAEQAASFAQRAIAALPLLDAALAARGDALAVELAEAHRRARTAAGATRRGLTVTAQQPADVLGVYVYLPIPPRSP